MGPAPFPQTLVHLRGTVSLHTEGIVSEVSALCFWFSASGLFLKGGTHPALAQESPEVNGELTEAALTQ